MREVDIIHRVPNGDIDKVAQRDEIKSGDDAGQNPIRQINLRVVEGGGDDANDGSAQANTIIRYSWNPVLKGPNIHSHGND